ncbi:MAG: UTP--glucose-1-phosphate uridylyltransferase [Chlamydiia bacterium]
MKLSPSEGINSCFFKNQRINGRDLTDRENTLVETVFEINQGHIFSFFDGGTISELRLQNLLIWLDEIDQFFLKLGGLRGFQQKISALLEPEKTILPALIPYEPLRLVENEQTFQGGILLQEDLVEIIVLGGAAERLNFIDQATLEPLPAFLYPFMGKPLLEWLVEDVISRETLFHEKTLRHVTTPIIFMTSMSKNNHELLKKYLISKDFFGRSSESFIFLDQPLVPYVDRHGFWLLDAGKNVIKNPCGHGALWNLLLKTGTLDRIEMAKKFALIRQINNPMTAFFDSIPLFLKNVEQAKGKFSILCTDAIPGMKEGKILRLEGGNFTNFEYTQEYGAHLEGFSNVNAIVVSLDRLKHEIEKDPFPGLLLNFKGGDRARFEMSMQNLMDKMQDVCVCYLDRAFAIQAIKRGGEGIETRLMAFDHLQKLYSRKFLSESSCTQTTLVLHPHITRSNQWWVESKIANHSFMKLDLLFFEAENCFLDGAFIAESSTGKGKVILKGVKIINRGICSSPNDLAEGDVSFHEVLHIEFEGEGTCLIQNITLNGMMKIKIKDQEFFQIVG